MPIRGVAGADYVDAMTKPINDIIDAQKDFMSGKITKEVYQNQLDVKTVHANLEIMSDPKMAQIVTLSKAMGANFDLKILSQTGTTVVNYLKRTLEGAPAGNMTPDDPAEQAQTKVFLDTLRQATKNLGNKDLVSLTLKRPSRKWKLMLTKCCKASQTSPLLRRILPSLTRLWTI